MKARSKRSRVESSICASRPLTSCDPTAEEFRDPTTDVEPPTLSLSNASIRSMMDTIMTIRAAYGQLLLDVLTYLQALQVDLVSTRGSTPQPPPLDDES